MTTINVVGPSKLGVHRRGRRVFVCLEAPNIYEATRIFDVWMKEEVSFNFTGPRCASETEDETCLCGKPLAEFVGS